MESQIFCSWLPWETNFSSDACEHCEVAFWVIRSFSLSSRRQPKSVLEEVRISLCLCSYWKIVQKISALFLHIEYIFIAMQSQKRAAKYIFKVSYQIVCLFCM